MAIPSVKESGYRKNFSLIATFIGLISALFILSLFLAFTFSKKRIEGDFISADVLQCVFAEYEIDTAIHFAGLKTVGEPVVKPFEYYRNNFLSTNSLYQLMLDK